MLDLIVKVFELCHHGNGYFVPFVRCHMLQQEYKEAAVLASRLKLQHYFDIRQVRLSGMC